MLPLVEIRYNIRHGDGTVLRFRVRNAAIGYGADVHHEIFRGERWVVVSYGMTAQGLATMVTAIASGRQISATVDGDRTVIDLGEFALDPLRASA